MSILLLFSIYKIKIFQSIIKWISYFQFSFALSFLSLKQFGNHVEYSKIFVLKKNYPKTSLFVFKKK